MWRFILQFIWQLKGACICRSFMQAANLPKSPHIGYAYCVLLYAMTAACMQTMKIITSPQLYHFSGGLR